MKSEDLKKIGRHPARDLRIVFMGTPDFAVGVLKKMLECELQVVGVITAPDRRAGRGRKLRASAVKEFALEHDLKVLQPTNLKDEEFVKELRSLQADLQVVVAFRMLPEVVWAMPELGTFNLHASLLPLYRGAAPINWAIINRETETGVTTFFIDEKIDTGAIIKSVTTPIYERETAGTLHDRLMHIGSELVTETVEMIAEGKAEPKAQPETAVYKPAPKLNPYNTRIDWSLPAHEVDAVIRGLDPYPGAWALLWNKGEELKLKVFKVAIETEGSDLQPGEIEVKKKKLKVGTGQGDISVLELQLSGKRRMSISELLNGYDFEEGAKFS